MIQAALKKEFSLVFRDLHSIAVLFIMPAIFIVIMSLAMQDQFSNKDDAKVELFVMEDDGAILQGFSEELKSLKQFEIIEISPTEKDSAFERLNNDEVKAFIVIPGYKQAYIDDDESFDFEDPPVEIWFSPQMDKRSSLLVESAILERLVKAKIPGLLKLKGVDNADKIAEEFTSGLIQTHYIYQQKGEAVRPSAVQQNVPAWLIFSMFFVVIPISTTLVTEKQQGTLIRLRTMNVSMSIFLFVKTLPYLVINQVQLIIMLLIGMYVIPILGGDTLDLGSSFSGLALMALATGFASVGLGLLVAVIVKTTEQATVLGGVGNILLAAIGGIMVPKFIMPETMQTLTNISPMAWALEGFLDIFLRGGGLLSILSEAAMLFGFGGVMLMLAIVVFHQKRDG